MEGNGEPITDELDEGKGAKAINTFSQYLKGVLDGLEINNQGKVREYMAKLGKQWGRQPDWYSNYLQWVKGRQFALKDQVDEAIWCFSRAQAFTPHIDDLEFRFKGRILGDLGEVLLVKGQYTEALKALRMSLLNWSDEGKQSGWVYLNMGNLFMSKGQCFQATEAYRKAWKTGAPHVRLLSLSKMIQSAKELNHEKEAKQLVVQAYWQMKNIDQAFGAKGEVYCSIGEVSLWLGRFRIAELAFKKGIHYAGKSGDIPIKHRALIGLAGMYMQKDEIKLFKEIMGELVREITSGADDKHRSAQLNLTGWGLIKEGKFQQAKQILQEAYTIATQAKLWPELINSCEGLQKCSLALHDPAGAEFYRKEIVWAKKKRR